MLENQPLRGPASTSVRLNCLQVNLASISNYPTMDRDREQMLNRWSYSLWVLGVYLATFTVWKMAPSRASFLVVGALAVVWLGFQMVRAFRADYFVDRLDVVLHGWVLVDIALESLAFEAFRWLQPFAVLEAFHDNLHFIGCAVVLSLLVGGYRANGLRRRTKASAANADPPPALKSADGSL
jgi:hypothetical protein